MFLTFEVVTVFLVSMSFGVTFAHALELPGKMRLNEADYLAVQAIYYPGFTIGGIAEPVAIVATLILVLITSRNTAVFWLALLAFVALFAMHIIFWLVTQPANRYWLKSQQLKGLGA